MPNYLVANNLQTVVAATVLGGVNVSGLDVPKRFSDNGDRWRLVNR